ncbi:hypothetical protein [Acinetobacter rathckeae]|uniref:hypothetical protein n=1 Tax=Acinetobacter rathckeae TaxID=2605272 RepID=UPI0018A24AFE|nr:hypothetical protein [Acinetobacter rathckeae]MBF7687724.1 hypothetical protein [Acinetobacter rathckeae]MBF7688053.1 hypothetical protein [Acinetobacter rathckeae]
MKKLLAVFLLCISGVSHSANNIKSDSYILGLVGQKAVEVEDVSASYNSATKIYYYSKTSSTGLELQLNKETIEVAWLFLRREKLEENKKAEQMAISFTEKLLGKQSMDLLIKPMKSGQSIQSIKISGVTITGARCGSTQCVYSIVR